MNLRKRMDWFGVRTEKLRFLWGLVEEKYACISITPDCFDQSIRRNLVPLSSSLFKTQETTGWRARASAGRAGEQRARANRGEPSRHVAAAGWWGWARLGSICWNRGGQRRLLRRAIHLRWYSPANEKLAGMQLGAWWIYSMWKKWSLPTTSHFHAISFLIQSYLVTWVG